MSQVDTLCANALDAIGEAESLDRLDTLRVELLGRKGSLTTQLKELGMLPAAERPAAGKAINEAKRTLTDAISARRAELEAAALADTLSRDAVDVTLAGRHVQRGTLHPVTRTLRRMRRRR